MSSNAFGMRTSEDFVIEGADFFGGDRVVFDVERARHIIASQQVAITTVPTKRLFEALDEYRVNPWRMSSLPLKAFTRPIIAVTVHSDSLDQQAMLLIDGHQRIAAAPVRGIDVLQLALLDEEQTGRIIKDRRDR